MSAGDATTFYLRGTVFEIAGNMIYPCTFAWAGGASQDDVPPTRLLQLVSPAAEEQRVRRTETASLWASQTQHGNTNVLAST